ncbi:MAG: hypothetical protein LBH98_02000 [Chitinispirillales bacterium]|jgi:Mor family transcriptional regulator|nr:hypothetical protein [Chitinispirillales bacterium]
MVRIFLVIFVFVSFLAAVPHTLEQLQYRLDSLNFLRREAIKDGDDGNEFSSEIKQLERAIITKNNEMKADGSNKSDDISDDKENIKKTPLKNEEDNLNFFTNRSVLDNLVIVMGAIAVLAMTFLIFARIFLIVSQKNKNKRTSTAKKLPDFETKKEILPKTANVLTEIDRYKERTKNLENVTYSIKELAQKYQTSDAAVVQIEPKTETMPNEEPKQMRALKIKNEIVKRFDNGEDTAKIAQDFSMSKDQVVMILNLAGRK